MILKDEEKHLGMIAQEIEGRFSWNVEEKRGFLNLETSAFHEFCSAILQTTRLHPSRS